MKKPKISAIITSVMFVAVILVMSLVNILKPQKTFSANENRYLETMPEFTWSGLFDGSFTSKFETAITDQFILRDMWVSIKNQCEILLQKQETNGVYFGKDNYLIEKFDEIDYEKYLKNIDRIKLFSSKMEEIDVNVQTMLIPTASEILSDKLFAYTPELDQQKLLNMAENVLLSDNFIDVTQTMLEHKDEYIYYRNDHHWTTLGAFYAYNYFLEQNGMEPHSLEDFEQEILSEDFLGTTQSKANSSNVVPDIITAFNHVNGYEFKVEYNKDGKIFDSLYDTSYLNKKDKYPVFLKGNQSVTKITGGVENGKKILLIKDSYANTLAPLIANDYEEVYMIDLRFYKMSVEDFIKENDIQDVLFLYNLKGFSEDYSIASLY